jgi:molecular chaperone HscB
MNYFELYDIPLSFQPDLSLVKKRFYALSRQYHPDFFGGANEVEKQEVLEISARVNKAYKVFQKQDELIKYILQLKGLLEEEEKYSLPPEFLMEVMDLNEQVMELDKSDTAALEAILAIINELEKNIYDPVEAVLTDSGSDHFTEKTLLQVKAYYFKKKYLSRIRGELEAGL